MTGYDIERIRKDFPILDRQVHGRPLVYLDSANTSQKPRPVLETLTEFYEQHNANVARAVHTLGEEATAAYEQARAKVARFVNAGSPREVVFTKNASEALNLVAYTLGNGGLAGLGPGDEVVVTEMEHHSNLVPWQLLCQRTGATLKWIGITDDGRLDLSDLAAVVSERTRVVSLVHQSNILGTINPVEPVLRRAREVGALVALDASQSAPHGQLDVRGLDVDFAAFTGHKMLGPTGVGVLWGRLPLLEAAPPFLGGGEMIEEVTMAASTYKAPPHKFEAGTPPIAQAVGLGAAVDYLDDLLAQGLREYEHELVGYALDGLGTVPGLRIIGPADNVDRGNSISFAMPGIHPHDVGQVLDELGVAVRVGHHCARPVCLRFGVTATTRASLYVYSTRSDVDALVAGLDQVKRYFG